MREAWARLGKYLLCAYRTRSGRRSAFKGFQDTRPRSDHILVYTFEILKWLHSFLLLFTFLVKTIQAEEPQWFGKPLVVIKLQAKGGTAQPVQPCQSAD